MAEGESTPEVVALLEEIVKLDPLDGEALLLLGKHYGKKQQADRAIFYYERAASIEAFEVEAKVRHAQVLVGMSRCAEAVPLLRRAQQVKPREEIARYLEQVERVARTQR
jgi:cytochrome c-type biogenesis protein CcmH/NrfG